jgi:hypothetical protein
MPTLQRFDNARVVMCLDDHPPPHVHVRLRDGRECTVEIDSLEVNGRIVQREIREALAWVEANRVFLHDEWRRCCP